MEVFKTVIKSIVIPYQHGATLVEIQKDYQELEGRPLPYRELRFSNPRDLLASLSDTLRQAVNRFGETVYLAVHGESTLHIQEMVMNQKTVCKKKKRGGRGGAGISRHGYGGGRPIPYGGGGGPLGLTRNLPEYPPYRPSQPPIQRSINPNLNNNFWDWPAVSNNTGGGSSSSSSSSNNNNNNNNNSNNNNNVLKPTQQPNIQSNNGKQKNGPATYARATEALLSNYDIRKIRELLFQYGPEGIKMPLFQILYKDKFGEELDPKCRGFNDLQHMLSSIKNVCKVEIHSSFKFYVVKLLNYNKDSLQDDDSPKVKELPKPDNSEKPSEKMTNGGDENHPTPKVNLSPTKSLHPRVSGPSNGHKDVHPTETPKSQRLPIKTGHTHFPFVPLNQEDPLLSLRTLRSSNSKDAQSSVKQENPEEAELDELENFPTGVIVNFKRILSKYPNGIPATRFQDEYEEMTGAPLDPCNWSYFSLMEVFHALPSIFFVDPPGARQGQESNEDDECDPIIYNSETVPQSVKTRVERYQARSSQTNGTVGEIEWATKVRIMCMLMKVSNSLPLKNFSTDFYINFEETIAPERYGFKTFEDMFAKICEELPITLEATYAGDDYHIFLRENYLNDWIDLCIKRNHYDAIRRFTPQQNVLLPGDTIIEVAVDKKYVDTNEWIEVILASVVHPNCFFIDLKGENHSQELDELMKKLHFYSTIPPDHKEFAVPECFLHKDFYCCAIFEGDQNWHRVKVVKVEANRKKVKVFFIDYGGEAIVDSSQLRLLKKEWSYFPAQAIRVSLKGIRPNGERWHNSAKHAILKYMDRGMAKAQHVLGRLYSRKSPYLKESIKYEIEICDETEYGYEFLHKMLIEQGLAIEDDGKPMPPKPSPKPITNNQTNRNGEVIRPSIIRPIRIPTKDAKGLRMLKNLAKMQRLESTINSGGENSSTENYDDLDEGTKPTNGSNLNEDETLLSSLKITSSSNSGIIFPYHSKKDISFLKKLDQIEI